MCVHCGILTTNPRFCSRSCSATYNNKAFPKRTKRDRHCNKCSKVIESGRRCDDCRIIPVETLTVGQVKERYRSAGYGAWNHYTLIRGRARTRMLASGKNSCFICGYDRHVEAAHVIAVASFDADTLVSYVNRDDNIIPLCPNHHWEYDHGMLTLS